MRTSVSTPTTKIQPAQSPPFQQTWQRESTILARPETARSRSAISMKSSGGLSTFVIDSSNVTGLPQRSAATSAIRLCARWRGLNAPGNKIGCVVACRTCRHDRDRFSRTEQQLSPFDRRALLAPLDAVLLLVADVRSTPHASATAFRINCVAICSSSARVLSLGNVHEVTTVVSADCQAMWIRCGPRFGRLLARLAVAPMPRSVCGSAVGKLSRTFERRHRHRTRGPFAAVVVRRAAEPIGERRCRVRHDRLEHAGRRAGHFQQRRKSRRCRRR